jgi:hypothetical protein
MALGHTIELDKGAFAAWAIVVDYARELRLARPNVSLDEDRFR